MKMALIDLVFLGVMALIYVITFYALYKLYGKHRVLITSYLSNFNNLSPKYPLWLNVILIISVFLLSVTLQIWFLWVSVLFWLFILVFHTTINFYGYKFFSLVLFKSTFMFVVVYGGILLFLAESVRDGMGYYFIADYNVVYTTESSHKYNSYIDSEEVLFSHVQAGNEYLNYFLQFLFPHVYRVFLISFLFLFFLKNSVFYKRRNRHL